MSRRRLRQSGYSLMEVMIAVICIMASFAWTLSLVNTSVRANEDGWEQTVASQYAATWMERIKRDATRWTAAGVPTTTAWLTPGADCDTWFVPTPEIMGEQVAIDAYGIETDVIQDMRYCVNIKVVQAHTDRDVGLDALMVGVKVFWHRSARGSASVVDRRVGPFSTGCVQPLAQADETSGLIRTVEHYNVIHWSQR
jgi:Tfp pilus assembly protein PilV